VPLEGCGLRVDEPGVRQRSVTSSELVSVAGLERAFIGRQDVSVPPHYLRCGSLTGVQSGLLYVLSLSFGFKLRLSSLRLYEDRFASRFGTPFQLRNPE